MYVNAIRHLSLLNESIQCYVIDSNALLLTLAHMMLLFRSSACAIVILFEYCRLAKHEEMKEKKINKKRNINNSFDRVISFEIQTF